MDKAIAKNILVLLDKVTVSGRNEIQAWAQAVQAIERIINTPDTPEVKEQAPKGA